MANLLPNSRNVYTTIGDVEITTDAEGRFNLNTLHKASGGAKKDAPNEWLRLDGTKSLISELESQTADFRFGVINVIRGGSYPGTFAHELLAVSYAGWISPAFQLTVNQAFIDSRTNKSGHQYFNSELQVMQNMLQQLDDVHRQQAMQKQRQDAQERRIISIEDRQDRMDGDTGYRTVTAFLRENGDSLPLLDANALARRASQLCRERSIKIGEVPDERFGHVNSYPINILDEALQKWR